MLLRSLAKNKMLTGQRVLVRIDANVPIKNGKVVDGPYGKIAKSAVGLEWLMQRGARVIVMSHLGRPNGRRLTSCSLAPVAKRLGGLLHTRVPLSRDIVGPSVEKRIAHMQEGDILLLENIRFETGEEQNDPMFAKALARLADLYVNDAFAVSHRAHASLEAIAKELPSFAGPLLKQEVNVLEQMSVHPRSPFIVCLGGKKMQTKLPLMQELLPKADFFILGGALAHPFLLAQGKRLGKSFIDQEEIPLAKQLLEQFGQKIILPVDVVVCQSLRGHSLHREIPLEEIVSKDVIVDMGPKTMQIYNHCLKKAKTIIWNGPFGYCEIPAFCRGTIELARLIAARTGKAKTLVGGGDTIPLVEAAGVADRFSLLSTGGGAMLDFLTGEKLPGLEVLRK